MLNKVDVEVTNVKKPVSGGDSSLANAIRWAVSKGVFQFVDVETKERLKLGMDTIYEKFLLYYNRTPLLSWYDY